MAEHALHHIVLLGLMGVGKTTVGRVVAAELGWPLSDSDAEIEATQHVRAREVFATRGVRELHRLEADHLLEALARPGPLVVCAAASTIDDPGCRRALLGPGVLAVWLRGPAPLLASRFASGGHRPLLDADIARLLDVQQTSRRTRFAALDPLTIDVAGRTPAQSAAVVVAHVRSVEPPPPELGGAG